MKKTTEIRPRPEPPGHLSERSQQLWRELIHRARGASRRALFLLALEVWDRYQQARSQIAGEGLTVTTQETGAVHVHPLVRVEKDCRQQFLSLWRALGFDSAAGPVTTGPVMPRNAEWRSR